MTNENETVAMPDMTQTHPLDPLWSLSLMSVRADALDTALELGLFSQLLRPQTAATLAECTQLDEAALQALLDVLWSMGILLRRRCHSRVPCRYGFELASSMIRWLNPESPEYCGDSLRFRLHSMRRFGAQLPQLLRQGGMAPEAAGQSSWAQAAQSQIWQEQGAATAGLAVQAVRQLKELDGPRRFLDMGGGPGRVAIALAQDQPLWQGVVFDQPETAAVAGQAIARAGLSDRVRAQGGDMEQTPLGGGYDVIWCSSVLHFCADVPKMLARLYEALAPGGYLLAAHAELPDDRELAARILPYYLPLRMRGRTLWRQGELAVMMRQAGFGRLHETMLESYPLAPACLVSGRREAA